MKPWQKFTIFICVVVMIYGGYKPFMAWITSDQTPSEDALSDPELSSPPTPVALQEPSVAQERRAAVQEAVDTLLADHSGVRRWFSLISDHPVIDSNGDPLESGKTFTAKAPILVALDVFIEPDLESPKTYRHRRLVLASQSICQDNWQPGMKRDGTIEGYVQVDFIDLHSELTSGQARRMFLQAEQRWREDSFELPANQIRVSTEPTDLDVVFRDSDESLKVTVPSDSRALLEQVALRVCSTAPFNESLKIMTDRTGRPCIWFSPAHGARLNLTSAQARTSSGSFVVEVQFLPAGEAP